MVHRLRKWICEPTVRRAIMHILASLATLAIGTVIYLLYRPPSLLVFDWVELSGTQELVFSIRESAFVQNWQPADWVVYSLPDMLWVVAFGHGIFATLAGAGIGKRGYMAVAAVIGGTALISEIGQALDLVPGTFDWWDIVFYSAAILWLLFIATLEANSIRPAANRGKNHEQ